MTDIVGGVFALEHPVGADGGPAPWTTSAVTHSFASARAAIAVACAQTGGRVWLPSYLCDAVVEAAVRAGADIGWYSVDESLGWTAASIGAERGDLVVAIDYFGFPAPVAEVESLRAAGVRVLRDASQALLSPAGTAYDLEVFSVRKFFGVPDGGLLVDHTGTLSPPDEAAAPQDWWAAAQAAVSGRLAFDRGDPSRAWYDAFGLAESRCPVDPVPMSAVTRRLLAAGLPTGRVAERRRSNYRRLLEGLGEVALLPSLPDGVAPLGFPVVLDRRDEVRARLFAHRIYPPVHWEVRGVVPDHFERSQVLSGRELTLIVDQRYGDAVMDAQIRLVRECV